MKKPSLFASITLLAAFFATARPGLAQAVPGTRMFEQHCASCHGAAHNPAPSLFKLLHMKPEAIDAALSKAPHTKIQGLTEAEKRAIIYALANRKLGITSLVAASGMPNQCSSNPPLGDPFAKPMWNGWGNGNSNARFQSAKAAGLTAGQVPHLKLKWAFGFPAADGVMGQPTIAAGRVFIGVDTGAVYSLNAKTGCVYWSFQADSGVRNAISIGPVKGGPVKGAPVKGSARKGSKRAKYAIYFGDLRGNVYALNAHTGKLLWRARPDKDPMAVITAAPKLYRNRLYVPISSLTERFAGLVLNFPCCSFRGSVVALDAQTGRRIWQTYVIPEAPKPTRKTAMGIQQYAPAGGSVWNTPTIDPKRHALYIGTGDAYTQPAAKTTDSVMAMNLATGKVLWSVQDTKNDAWLVHCGPGVEHANCPSSEGPDFDFGSSPILRNLPGGRTILVAGQKSGMVWAHDPDHKGAVVWSRLLAKKLDEGTITMGGAADGKNAYFGVKSGGIAAVQLATGKIKWFTRITAPPGAKFQGETAAVTVIPGVVFSDGWDGMVRAFSTANGRLLWKYNTIREYRTVNHVPAKGGGMGGPGPTVADGMLFVGSGYVFGVSVAPGNVLLAFSAK